MRKILPFVLLLAPFAPCQEVKIGGGGASMASVVKPLKSGFDKASGMTLIPLQSTPADGLVDLWAGKIDAAVGAVPMSSMVGGAAKKGIVVDSALLQVQVLGTNRTGVFVHKDNPVAALSKDQLKGIFTGKIANWKEVGGKDAEIIVVWGRNTPGQNALFAKVILDGEAVTSGNLESSDYAGILQTVATNPEAVGIDPVAMGDATVKVFSTDPIVVSPILLLTKGPPGAGVKKFVEYLKGAGQAQIRR